MTIPFVSALGTFGDRTALVTASETITYRELAERADAAGALLGANRRLVAIAPKNTVDALAAYLGALRRGHVVLLLPPGDQAAEIVDRYDPDVLAGADSDGTWRIDVRRVGTAHQLHPDLALLLSTSGSTGSPKLVRLSQDNLQSNAGSIAAYLSLSPSDRAATTLPMHYCYGLSVVHSHLLAGASLILTDHSVSERRFWDLFGQAGGTSFAGVPYTFDLLDQIGFADFDLPDLRYVTQAGGRLDPQRVVRYAQLGRERGFDLVVMYGQTEATARMAYLPPGLAAVRPAAIGVPIPGGSFRIDLDIDEAQTRHGASATGDVGELIYQGPNVMLGYAESLADLSLGRTARELRTGDLARRAQDGLYEIVGRRSRFLKLFGLRIDLGRVEELVRERGLEVACSGTDDHLVVAVVEPAGGAAKVAGLATMLAEWFKLPAHAVTVCPVDKLPRLTTGKIDHEAVRRLAAVRSAVAPDLGPGSPVDVERAICRLYTEVLREPAGPADTFSRLGGDSLSFVQTSIKLERLLGRLPQDWQHLAVRELAAMARPVAARRATIDVSVALRAAAIVMVVLVHSRVLMVVGGAHLMLGIVGYNLARFQLDDAPSGQRIRRVASSLARVIVPTIAVVAVVLVVSDHTYGPMNLYLGYYLSGTGSDHDKADLWFIEVVVFYTIGALLLTATPWGYRLERRYPFALPMALVGLGLFTRYDLVPGMTASPWVSDRVTPLMVIWIFAIGWATARADKLWQKSLLTVTIVVTMSGYFAYSLQQEFVTGGLLLLVWIRTLPSTPLLNRILGGLAASSLFIYVTHYQVFPLFAWIGGPNIVGVVASLLVGVAYAALFNRVNAAFGSRVLGPAKAWWGRLGATDVPVVAGSSDRVGAGANGL